MHRVLLAGVERALTGRLADEHPDVLVVRADARSVTRLPRGATSSYLVDPLGNQVLAWPDAPDIRGMARDLAKVLKASRIG